MRERDSGKVIVTVILITCVFQLVIPPNSEKEKISNMTNIVYKITGNLYKALVLIYRKKLILKKKNSKKPDPDLSI